MIEIMQLILSLSLRVFDTPEENRDAHRGVASVMLLVDRTAPSFAKKIARKTLDDLLLELERESSWEGLTNEGWEELTGGDPGSWDATTD